MGIPPDVTGDPRPPARVRDAKLMWRLHLRWRECALCGVTGPRLSLHHVSKHPRDDVEANLVMLCGSGTTGCHGLIEAHDELTGSSLRDHLLDNRPDTVAYLIEKRGVDGAADYLSDL